MTNGYERIEKFIHEGRCPAKVHEEAIVTVPCAFRARSEVGDVTIKCVGEPIVTMNSNFAPGCVGKESKFTISQKLRVDIPILFIAEADVGEGHVVFGSEEKVGIPIQPLNRDCFC